MQGGYKIRNQRGIHFVTFTVVGWVNAFTRPKYKDFLIENLEYYRDVRGLIIHAYVIMDNHLHLVLASEKEPLSDLIRDYKKWTSRQMLKMIHAKRESRRQWMIELFRAAGEANPNNRKFQFWIQGNHPKILYSKKFARQKINYIHQNPVKAGIVFRAEDYIYSSASNYAGLGGVMEVDVLDVDLKSGDFK